MERMLKVSVSDSTEVEYILPSSSTEQLLDAWPLEILTCKMFQEILPSDAFSFLQGMIESSYKPTTVKLSLESSASLLEITISETSLMLEKKMSSTTLR